MTHYINALQKQICLKEGVSPTPENIEKIGVDENKISLLYETHNSWVVLEDTGEMAGQYIHIVWKWKNKYYVHEYQGRMEI
jgi:hypothetical protein